MRDDYGLDGAADRPRQCTMRSGFSVKSAFFKPVHTQPPL
jgi:hypothetical protein